MISVPSHLIRGLIFFFPLKDGHGKSDIVEKIGLLFMSQGQSSHLSLS